MVENHEEALGAEWLAHRFDESRNEIRFVEYDRATRASVPFFTDDYLPEKPYRAVARDDARRIAAGTAPIHFVFHSGFCCSTLFAACFDQPGLATTISEPMLFNDVTGWRKRGAAPAEVGRLLEDALALTARPFAGDGAVVVKPSTVVNGLAAAMLKLRPNARAVVMYAPLEDFLTSIAKKGLDGRLWVRELFLAMRREKLTEGLGFNDEQFFGQTDLQIAAIAWLGQQRLFSQLLELYPERVRSLDSISFLDDPERALGSGEALFSLETPTGGIVRPSALDRNSKDGKPYGRDAREAEYRAARESHGDEIEKVRAWAQAVASEAGVTIALPLPLS
jgi:hypothetical protein